MDESSRKKRVLILLPGFDLGGAEKQGFYIAKSMQDSGLYDVEVWGLVKGSGLLVASLENANIKHSLLEIPFSNFHHRLKRLASYIKFLRKLRTGRFDAIIPYTYHCNIMAASTFRFAGVAKCIWFQIAMEFHVPFSSFEKIALFFKPEYAANSFAAAKFISKRHSILESTVSFIPNPFEKIAPINNHEYWKVKIGGSDGDIIMVMSANFFPEKDHQTLIQGMVKLMAVHKNLKLVFAGGTNGNPAIHYLKSVAFDLKLQDKVVFLGSTNDISGLISFANIGILSSRSEGSPNSVIEYMGYELPVIATDIPAITELLGADYPYLFKVSDVDDFVSKADKMIRNLNNLNELIKRNRDIVETVYTVQSNFNAFHKLIQN
jgi:glycosyltransferase involved in cell wall biosynthesis